MKSNFICRFDPTSPATITVDGDLWSSRWRGQRFFIDWSTLPFADPLLAALKEMAHRELELTHAPTHLSALRCALVGFGKALGHSIGSLREVSLAEFRKVWEKLSPHWRSVIRELYERLLDDDPNAGTYEVLAELKTWRARSEVKHLREVLQWNPKLGALTETEFASLKEALKRNLGPESADTHATTMMLWALIETFRRPAQLMPTRRHALKKYGGEWFLQTPGAKKQIGRSRLRRISEAFAHALQEFSSRPEISILQKHADRIFVWPGSTTSFDLSSAALKSRLQDLVKSWRLGSARTGELLNVTPNRIRHTAGTRLAARGAPADVISDLLEHDSLQSAWAYIDAIGSDLIPALDKADRGLGSVFGHLAETFFKGTIVSHVKQQPIVIPTANEGSPSIVGCCGRDTRREGKCSRHPFHACYNGCPQFLAWRDADHERALAYTKFEIERWSAADHPDRPAALTELRALHAAIEEVRQAAAAAKKTK